MARRHAVQSRDQSPDGPRQETDAGVHGRRHNSNPSSQASPQPPHPAAPPRTTSPRATETNDPPTPSLVAVNANEYADARARSDDTRADSRGAGHNSNGKHARDR